MKYIEVNYDLSWSFNHYKNVKVHKNRNKFFKKICDGKINENNVIIYMNKYTKRKLHNRIIGKGKRIIRDLFI